MQVPDPPHYLWKKDNGIDWTGSFNTFQCDVSSLPCREIQAINIENMVEDQGMFFLNQQLALD